MTRVLAVFAAICALVLGAAGCSSSGTHVQSPGPTTPSSSDHGSSSSSSSPKASPSWTPPAYGAAQPAVDTYLKVQQIYNAALEHPTRFTPRTLTPYLAGQAQIVFLQSIADEKAHGKAFRGTPDTSRVLVVSSDLSSDLPEVVLSDCPLAARSDPWTEYVVSTGKPVPPVKQKVPPPYAATIKMFQPNRKQWVITSLKLDGSKTCTR